jgi:hypothetical protein
MTHPTVHTSTRGIGRHHVFGRGILVGDVEFKEETRANTLKVWVHELKIWVHGRGVGTQTLSVGTWT